MLKKYARYCEALLAGYVIIFAVLPAIAAIIWEPSALAVSVVAQFVALPGLLVALTVGYGVFSFLCEVLPKTEQARITIAGLFTSIICSLIATSYMIGLGDDSGRLHWDLIGLASSLGAVVALVSLVIYRR